MLDCLSLRMDVIVLGAGYAGVTLTRQLERSLPESVQLTVIDQSPNHLVQHEVHRAIRRPSIAEAIQVPLEDLFDRAAVRLGTVSDVDTTDRVVSFADGSTIEYDYAAICLGSETAYYGLEGVEEHSIGLKSLEEADRIRGEALDLIERGTAGTIVVGGAGLSGIQVAGELAALVDEEGASDRINIVMLEMQDSVAPSFPANFQTAVHDELIECGIDVRTETAVERAGPNVIETDGGDLPYDLFVWTGGIGGPDALSGERPIVRNDLRLDRSTFVLGDAAKAVDTDGEPVPASASAAIREAGTVAENITALVEHDLEGAGGFEPRMEPYRFSVPGWIVSVGTGAVAQVGPTVLTGAPAKAMKASVGAGYLSSVRAIKQAAELVEEEIRA